MSVGDRVRYRTTRVSQAMYGRRGRIIELNDNDRVTVYWDNGEYEIRPHYWFRVVENEV